MTAIPAVYQLRSVCCGSNETIMRWTVGSDTLDVHCPNCKRLMFSVAMPIDRGGRTRGRR